MKIEKSLLNGLIAICCFLLNACGDGTHVTKQEKMEAMGVQTIWRESAPPGQALMLGTSTGTTSGSNLLANPGFEKGIFQTDWTSTPSLIFVNEAHTGLYFVWMGGYTNAADSIWQEVAIPSTGSTTLDFWYWVKQDPNLFANFDAMTVDVLSTSNVKLATLASYPSSSPNTAWQHSAQFDLKAYAGTTIRIRFSANTGSYTRTSFYLDDVAVTVTNTSSGTTTGTTTGTTASANTFSGTRSRYTVVKSGSTYTVTEKSTGIPKILINYQTLVFSDVTLNLAIADKAKSISQADLNSLIELYIAYLGRVPDADGLYYWIDQFKSGKSLIEIGKTFYAAAIQYPDLTGYSATMTDGDFVKIIYKNVLGRSTVDTEGYNYWTSSLAKGTETRGTLVKTMLGAAHTYKGDASFGWVADLLDNKIKVGTSYAVDQGITFNKASDSVSIGIEIAKATTATSTSTALSLYGLVDAGFSLSTSCTSNCSSTGNTSGTGSTTGSGSTSGMLTFGDQKFTTISSGKNTLFGITASGELMGWGSGTFGALGSGSQSSFYRFTTVGTGFLSVSTTKGGDYVSFGIKTDGSLWAWGHDSGGLGNGSTGGKDILAPVQIGSNFESVAGGYGCSYGIKKDGSLWAWGWSCAGNKYVVPTQIGTNFLLATTSGYGLTAIKKDGSLWVWGFNDSRLVTTGYPKSSVLYLDTFKELTQVGTAYKALASTNSGVIALKTDGSLWTWGQGYYGEMGRGSLGNSAYLAPQQIGTGFAAISAGHTYALGIKTDGSLWSWGHLSVNSSQTGADSSIPKMLGSNFAKIFANTWTAYAVGTDGSLWGWGDNYSLPFSDEVPKYGAMPQKIK